MPGIEISAKVVTGVPWRRPKSAAWVACRCADAISSYSIGADSPTQNPDDAATRAANSAAAGAGPPSSATCVPSSSAASIGPPNRSAGSLCTPATPALSGSSPGSPTSTAPDEIWVIQINAKQTDSEPRTVVEIADRRNELSGNLSLYQELHFIETIDTMLEEKLLAPGKYKPITIRIIQMNRSSRSMMMGAASKINRDPAFLNELIAQGEQRTADFITALGFERAWLAEDLDSIADHFTDATVLRSEAPFVQRGPAVGLRDARQFTADLLAAAVKVDLTRKQLAGDHVRWRVHRPAGDDGGRVVGAAELRFDKGKVASFSLGPPA